MSGRGFESLLRLGLGWMEIESGRAGKEGGRGEQRVRMSLNCWRYHSFASSGSESTSPPSASSVGGASSSRRGWFLVLLMKRGLMEARRGSIRAQDERTSSSEVEGVKGRLVVCELGLEAEVFELELMLGVGEEEEGGVGRVERRPHVLESDAE
jgi:hypothetical protein